MLALCNSNCRHDTFTTLVADASYPVAGSVLEAKKLVLFLVLKILMMVPVYSYLQQSTCRKIKKGIYNIPRAWLFNRSSVSAMVLKSIRI